MINFCWAVHLVLYHFFKQSCQTIFNRTQSQIILNHADERVNLWGHQMLSTNFTFFGWKFILGALHSFSCARASHFSSINVADKQKRASFILVFCLCVRAFSTFFISVLLSLFTFIFCLCVSAFSTFFLSSLFLSFLYLFFVCALQHFSSFFF